MFVNNISFMIIFYILMVFSLFKKQTQVYGSEILEYTKLLRSICTTLSILITVYLVILIPMGITSCGVFVNPKLLSNTTCAVIYSLFLWIYGINFFIFFSTSKRIRAAYRRFLKDMWKITCKRSRVTQSSTERETETESSNFWIGLRNLEERRPERRTEIMETK